MNALSHHGRHVKPAGILAAGERFFPVTPSAPGIDAPVLAYERGRLDVDPATGRLRCHLCGRWWVSLAQHALRRHGLPAPEYRELAGLNRTTRLLSANRRDQIRRASLPIIERLRAEGKLLRWNEDPEKLAADKAAAVAVIQQGMTLEARSKRLKENLAPERRAQMAEHARRRNLTGEHRATPAAIKEGLRRRYQEQPERRTCQRCSQAYQADHTGDRYCRPCRAEHTREYQRDWKRRSRGLDPAECGPWERACPHCGRTFTAQLRREIYCPPCRPEVQRARQRTWKQARKSRPA